MIKCEEIGRISLFLTTSVQGQSYFENRTSSHNGVLISNKYDSLLSDKFQFYPILFPKYRVTKINLMRTAAKKYFFGKCEIKNTVGNSKFYFSGSYATIRHRSWRFFISDPPKKGQIFDMRHENLLNLFSDIGLLDLVSFFGNKNRIHLACYSRKVKNMTQSFNLVAKPYFFSFCGEKHCPWWRHLRQKNFRF